MLRREVLPLYGRKVADALATSRGEMRITLWPEHWRPNRGAEEIELGWEELSAILADWRPFRGDFYHPGWCAATFAPAIRTRGNVRSVAALVQRFTPERGISIEAFGAAWSMVKGVLYTAHDHRADRSSFVAVFPYRRALSLREHLAVVAAICHDAMAERIPFDSGAADPARFVHLPGAVPGHPFRALRLEI